MSSVAQSCPTLCDPMDCSLPGSSLHGDSPGKNTGVDCHALLQGILPVQGSNRGLPHCRQILYHLSHQGSPNRGVNCHQPPGLSEAAAPRDPTLEGLASLRWMKAQQERSSRRAGLSPLSCWMPDISLTRGHLRHTESLEYWGP